MMDLTTLEGKDTPGKIRAMCAKAHAPAAGRPVDPVGRGGLRLPGARRRGQGGARRLGVKVASVATGFPSGQTFRDIKLAETRAAVAAGADEIDMVIDRGAFLAGDYRTVFEEIVERQGGLRRGAPQGDPRDRRARDVRQRPSRVVLAMAAGADFIKTSTGKVHARRDAAGHARDARGDPRLRARTGRQVGMKPAGGIRTAKEAIQYLVVLYETLGPRWMTPDWFRFGASSLLNDVLMQIELQRTGATRTPTTSRSTDEPDPRPARRGLAARDRAGPLWSPRVATLRGPSTSTLPTGR